MIQHDHFIRKTGEETFSHQDITGAETAAPFAAGPVQTVNRDDHTLAKQTGQPAEKRGSLCVDMHNIIIAQCGKQTTEKAGSDSSEAFAVNGRDVFDANTLVFFQMFCGEFLTADVISRAVITGHRMTLSSYAGGQLFDDDFDSSFMGLCPTIAIFMSVSS